MPIRSLSRLAWIAALAGLVMAIAVVAVVENRRSAGTRTPASWNSVVSDTGWAELPIRGRTRELGVGPDGRLWMGSMQGEIFSADSVNGDWRMVSGPPPNPDDSLDLGTYLPRFDRVTWVSARTGIASGYVGRGESPAKDVVLRTTDGGVRWDTVSFGVDQRVYDAFVDRNGGVWMGGSSGTLVVSGDSGRTWKTVATLFDGNTRLGAIWIDDGRTGVVAAVQNGLKLTRDGGRSWQALPTPLDQKQYRPADDESSDHHFEAVALIGGTLWAAQGGHLFTSPLARVRWTEVAPGEALHTFTVDRASGTLYAPGESRRVYEIGADGVPRRLSETPLNARAGQLAVRAGVVYVVDERGGLYRVSRGRVVYSRPLTRGTRPTLWRVVTAPERTWGTSGHALYATADGGRSWRLMGTSPQDISGIQPLDGGRLMLWSGHGFNAVLDPRAGRLEEIARLRGHDVVGIVAAESLWVAFGGRQYESAERVDLARTFYPGEFEGSRANGFVFVSRDRGRTWTRVDEWPKHGVSGVFVHPDGRITLLSYLGSVRRLTPAGTRYRAETLVTATPRNRDAVPYVQEAGGLYFDGNEGWLDGWIHHLGNRRYVTHDGGRTWAQTEVRAHHYQALFPARGGWVGSTGHRLFWIAGGSEREFFDAGGREARHDAEYDRPTIRHAAAAPDGGVTVLLQSGQVQRVELPK